MINQFDADDILECQEIYKQEYCQNALEEAVTLIHALYNVVSEDEKLCEEHDVLIQDVTDFLDSMENEYETS